jgi:hypothetical protein
VCTFSGAIGNEPACWRRRRRRPQSIAGPEGKAKTAVSGETRVGLYETCARGCLRHATPAIGLTASVFICLGLAVCAAPTTPHWQKAATDDATTERELRDCNDQANAALARQQALIDETVGRNWMLQGFAVVPLQRQLLLQQATEDSERVLDNCMRGKGFTK